MTYRSLQDPLYTIWACVFAFMHMYKILIFSLHRIPGMCSAASEICEDLCLQMVTAAWHPVSVCLCVYLDICTQQPFFSPGPLNKLEKCVLKAFELPAPGLSAGLHSQFILHKVAQKSSKSLLNTHCFVSDACT